MRVEALKRERIEDFAAYCRKHRIEVDDSFLYDKDLKNFEADDENPTYIIENELGDIIAAASLIIDEYNRRGRNARFRIFHSENADIECYNALLQALLKHTEGLDHIFIYVPMVNKKLEMFIERLNFYSERYICLLVRNIIETAKTSLPEGYEIRTFRKGKDEEIWCEIRNIGFSNLKGNETPKTPEMVKKMTSEEDYIEGGLMILYHGEKSVGIVRGAADEYEDSPIMNIGPLVVLPEYQGKGLGRCLLRGSMDFAREKSYRRVILCVNAENEGAKTLYIQEGFEQVEAVTCYKYDLTRKQM